jgi:hypothetical protein
LAAATAREVPPHDLLRSRDVVQHEGDREEQRGKPSTHNTRQNKGILPMFGRQLPRCRDCASLLLSRPLEVLLSRLRGVFLLMTSSGRGMLASQIRPNERCHNTSLAKTAQSQQNRGTLPLFRQRIRCCRDCVAGSLSQPPQVAVCWRLQSNILPSVRCNNTPRAKTAQPHLNRGTPTSVTTRCYCCRDCVKDPPRNLLIS